MFTTSRPQVELPLDQTEGIKRKRKRRTRMESLVYLEGGPKLGNTGCWWLSFNLNGTPQCSPTNKIDMAYFTFLLGISPELLWPFIFIYFYFLKVPSLIWIKLALSSIACTQFNSLHSSW